MEKVRRALEELVKAEQEAKAQLANLDKELEDTKAVRGRKKEGRGG